MRVEMPAVCLLLLAACGPGVAHRTLDLTILNLSASAESLTVSLYTLDVVPDCASLSSGLTPAATSAWQRSSDAPRSLELESIDEDTVILEAIAQDANGQDLQRACRVVEWVDLERPEVDIELSPVEGS